MQRSCTTTAKTITLLNFSAKRMLIALLLVVNEALRTLVFTYSYGLTNVNITRRHGVPVEGGLVACRIAKLHVR